MVIDINEDRLVKLPQLRQFVEGTTEVEFRRCGKDEDRYRHIEGVLRRFRYGRLKRADKGLVVRYLMRTTDPPAALYAANMIGYHVTSPDPRPARQRANWGNFKRHFWGDYDRH
jgi:hypothetical protein